MWGIIRLMANDNKFKLKHVINGIWTLSMFDDLKITFRSIKSISNIYGYLLVLLIFIPILIITMQYQNISSYNQIIVFSFLALTIINIISLLYGVYSTMLLIPSIISWSVRIMVMIVLLCSFTFLNYILDSRTNNYVNPFKFNILDSTIIGLTGLSVIEDIYFIGINTQLFMLTLSMPMHITISIFTFLILSFLTGIIIALYFSPTVKEAYKNNEYKVLLFLFIDASIKTMTMFTVATCIWFNIVILPISNVFISTTISLLLTASFSYAYYFLDLNFKTINQETIQQKLENKVDETTVPAKVLNNDAIDIYTKSNDCNLENDKSLMKNSQKKLI